MKKTLTIGIIQQDPDIGGAETYMVSLLKEFKKSGAKIFLASDNTEFLALSSAVCFRKSTIPTSLDVIGNIRGLIKSCFRLPYAVWYYSTLLYTWRKKGVEVLLMSGYSEKMLVTLLALFYDLPVVWVEHGPLTTIFNRCFGIPRILYTLCWSRAQHIITPSNLTRDNLMKEMHIPPSHITTVYDGVHLPQLPARNKRNNKIIIGSVSRLTSEKGQQILIAAFSIILKKFPNLTLHIIGRGPDMLLFGRQAERLGVANDIVFKGFVDDIDRAYRDMDIFVFPTIWELEGFGLVMAEAMAHSLPVVASDFGPVSEVVIDNKTGLLFKAGDADDLSKKLLRLLKNEKQRELFGKAGRQRVEEYFNIERSAEKILSILKRAGHIEKN